jgi:hypothetical protein
MSDSVIIQNKSYLQHRDAGLNVGFIGEYREEEGLKDGDSGE